VRGSDLRKLRKHLGLTTDQLAQSLRVAQATVSRWETGERKIHPAFERLIKLTFGRAARFARKTITGGERYGPAIQKADAHPWTRIRRGV